MMLFRAIAFLCMTHVAGCGLFPRQSSGDILVIGDSVLAWNGGTVGDVIASELDRDVVSRAALGARIDASGAASLVGLSIPDQLSDGRWNWIVMNGGANDIGGSCGCERCDAVIDGLISLDGTVGDIPDLIAKARRTGAQVLWMGYYQAPLSQSFKGCRPGLVELERRVAKYARSHTGVYFVDAEDVIDPANPGLLSSDRTHPSRQGSTIIGRFLARTIAERP